MQIIPGIMFKKEILENQRKIREFNLIKRIIDLDEIESVFKLNKIISFIGLRRVGKTFLTFQVVKEFCDRKIIELENVVYIDFSGILNKDLDLELIENSYFKYISG